MTNTRWTIENATPRPWRHKTSDGSLGNVVDANGDCIAQTQQRLEDKSKGGHAMRQANAELIAAAVNAYSPSDAEQLSELRTKHDSALRDLKQAAFAFHVEANHKPEAFATCRNAICANACRAWSAHVELLTPQKEKVRE